VETRGQGERTLFAETFAERIAPCLDCLDCHGEKGYSEQPVVPSLGGQPAPYLLIQRYLFRENQRASTYRKGDRMVEIMSAMTKGFTDDDLRKFSDFLSRLPPPLRLVRPGADDVWPRAYQRASVQ
jgi:cytochrome c553